jgi:hypothetical protein
MSKKRGADDRDVDAEGPGDEEVKKSENVPQRGVKVPRASDG